MQEWLIQQHRRVDKFFKKLKKSDRTLFVKLSEDYELVVAELKLEGPEGPKRWKNFGLLVNQPGDAPRYHCHISRDYVVCWEIKDYEIQLIEVYHVSSHQNAPY